jgi:hypothetical protein
MKEYSKLLEEYSSGYYLIFSSDSEETVDSGAAERYLERYWLAEAEYQSFWKPIQDQIFINQERGLPEPVFSENYEVIVLRGGVLFVEDDFRALQECFMRIGDKNFVIIENTFGKASRIPPFKMKYPVDVSWEDLMSGSFISAVLFKACQNEYFVFGDSAVWGKYAANDYDYPLEVIGFKPEYASLFREKFQTSEEERQEIAGWLPPAYKKFVALS